MLLQFVAARRAMRRSEAISKHAAPAVSLAVFQNSSD
jgi:hypothetical protein